MRAAPAWLRTQMPPEWFDRYSLRFGESRWPTEKPDRAALATSIGADGCHLLTAVDTPTPPGWLREIPAVQLLRHVCGQQYDAPRPGQPVRWREDADAQPAALLIRSPYDPEARYRIKRQTPWVGYKVHLTETCDTPPRT